MSCLYDWEVISTVHVELLMKCTTGDRLAFAGNHSNRSYHGQLKCDRKDAFTINAFERYLELFVFWQLQKQTVHPPPRDLIALQRKSIIHSKSRAPS